MVSQNVKAHPSKVNSSDPPSYLEIKSAKYSQIFFFYIYRGGITSKIAASVWKVIHFQQET